MPSQRHHEPGDLYVKINIAWPETIDPSKIGLLEQVLPPRRGLPGFGKGVLLEDVDMHEMDARQRAAAMGGGDDNMDEDEGEPRVQCANQ